MDHRDEFRDMTNSQVAEFMLKAAPDSVNDYRGRVEFLLRQTEYQERAALATEQAAKSTARYTKYMFWSVIVLAASVLVSILMG
jgi:folate-binding Fe-S cluster repair protein YgfZ